MRSSTRTAVGETRSNARKRVVSTQVAEAAKPDPRLIAKLHKVRETLNHLVFERKSETDGILLCILSGASALFLGDVGTAKTHHIQLASQMLGLSSFDILMSETIKPDQIFGPVDIPALAAGKQQTKYIGYAPDSEILFFDEIFKANATVLNPLLWLINEHRFRDGDNGVITCKVKATFAASNELPTDPILKALFDRFLFRFQVSYLKDESNTRKLIERSLSTPDELSAVLTSKEVEQLRKYCRAIPLPADVRDTAITIRRMLEQSLNYTISDRRFVKSFRAMQASALLNGRSRVELEDLEVMADMMWEDPSQIAKTRGLVYAYTSKDTAELSTYLEKARELKARLSSGGDLRSRLRAVHGLFTAVKSMRGRYAEEIANEIRSIGNAYKRVMEARRTFRVVRVDLGSTEFKVPDSVAMVWSFKELKGFGLRKRRKPAYWYTDGSINTLRTKLLQIGVTLEVTNMANSGLLKQATEAAEASRGKRKPRNAQPSDT